MMGKIGIVKDTRMCYSPRPDHSSLLADALPIRGRLIIVSLWALPGLSQLTHLIPIAWGNTVTTQL